MTPPRDRTGEPTDVGDGGRAADPADGPGMTPTRWTRVEEIFTAALERSGAARTAFLDEACAGDAALRADVESLLDSHDRGAGRLDAARPWLGEDEGPAAGHAAEDRPARIGPYAVVRELGHGGMGRVYLAERRAPGVSVLVAVKLMRRGLDTDELLARFRMERQILSRLNHPNIARLFDVGATEDGRPYFVMEYVDGAPIAEFCDRERLTVEQRLRLFRTVCDAVQHAHRELIVHRDLKPQNILVTPEGAPKLLDFGIAKILDPDHPSGTSLTRDDRRVLTPEYGAPEQIRGEQVNTACDTYALGVILYELLAGRHPYAEDGVGRAELERRALEADPPPPSAAVAAAGPGAEPGVQSEPDAADVAAARRTTPAQLRRTLAGDLDTIVLEALRKEPAERYASVLSLADDIDRHLAGLPVRARPPTAGYRLRKFVRRNRIAVAAGAAFVLVLGGFTAFTSYQSGRIREESARVSRERDKALEVRGFLLEMFGTSGPDDPTGDTVTARQLLDRRAATLEAAYPEDPEMRAEMMAVLAEGYEKLGLFERAEPLAREALEVRRATLPAAHPDLVASLNLLGWLERQRGRLDEAEPLLREAVEVGRAAFGEQGDPRLARALNDLGAVRSAVGANAEAAELLRESIAMRLRLLGEDHMGVAISTSNLAVTLYSGGDLEGAVRAGEDALERFQRILGPDHQRTMMAETNLAALYGARGDNASAAGVHRRILERRRRLFGDRHASVATSMMMLANTLAPMDELEEAERLAAGALEIQREASGVRRDELAWTWRVLGGIKARAGRPADALPDYEQSLALLRATVGDVHEQVALVLALRASAHEALGDTGAAERGYRDAARMYVETLGEASDRTLGVRLSLAELLEDAGRDAEARAELQEVQRALDAKEAPDDHPLRLRAAELRASVDSTESASGLVG